MLRVILILIIYFCASVNSDCIFHSDESKSLQDKMKNWDVYKKNFIVKSSTSQYQIGICVEPSSSLPNAAIIQTEKNETSILGQLNQVNLNGGDNWVLLTYENGTRYNNTCYNNSRSASIMFICGANTNNLTLVQEHTTTDSHCNYLFQIHIPSLCPETPQVKKGLSGAAIFFIILLCLASTYLIGGFLYMRIKCGARGIDQIPNLDMWRRLGNLAADGCDYCCRCKSGTPRAGYFIDESGPDLRGDDDILAP